MRQLSESDVQKSKQVSAPPMTINPMGHGLWVLVNEMGKTKAANLQTFMCIPEYGVNRQVQTFRSKEGRGSRYD